MHLYGFIEALHQRKYLLRVAFEGDARHMTSERIKGKADTFVTAAVDGVAEECGNSLRIRAGQVKQQAHPGFGGVFADHKIINDGILLGTNAGQHIGVVHKMAELFGGKTPNAVCFFALQYVLADVIADGAVGTAAMASGAVTTDKLGATSVTAAKLGASSVETAKIADAAVTTAKMADGSVTMAKLGATVTIAKGGTGATDGATALKNLLAAGATILSSNQYGTSLPSTATAGRLFFKKV